jgi:hypothetical protein
VHVEALHPLRSAANAAKHDPKVVPGLGEVQDILSEALAAISRVGIEGVANGADESVENPRPRRYAILVADYPTGGEVDYQIAALLPDGQLVDLDSFQARYANESSIVEALRTAGNLDQDPADRDGLLDAISGLVPLPPVATGCDR